VISEIKSVIGWLLELLPELFALRDAIRRDDETAALDSTLALRRRMKDIEARETIVEMDDV
jgi:hypothetical protein